jgi:hypothetical protein
MAKKKPGMAMLGLLPLLMQMQQQKGQMNGQIAGKMGYGSPTPNFSTYKENYQNQMPTPATPGINPVEPPVQMPQPMASNQSNPDPAFAINIQDRSNDKGFAMQGKDKSNDFGFWQGYPAQTFPYRPNKPLQANNLSDIMNPLSPSTNPLETMTPELDDTFLKLLLQRGGM